MKRMENVRCCGECPYNIRDNDMGMINYICEHPDNSSEPWDKYIEDKNTFLEGCPIVYKKEVILIKKLLNEAGAFTTEFVDGMGEIHLDDIPSYAMYEQLKEEYKMTMSRLGICRQVPMPINITEDMLRKLKEREEDYNNWVNTEEIKERSQKYDWNSIYNYISFGEMERDVRHAIDKEFDGGIRAGTYEGDELVWYACDEDTAELTIGCCGCCHDEHVINMTRRDVQKLLDNMDNLKRKKSNYDDEGEEDEEEQ